MSACQGSLGTYIRKLGITELLFFAAHVTMTFKTHTQYCNICNIVQSSFLSTLLRPDPRPCLHRNQPITPPHHFAHFWPVYRLCIHPKRDPPVLSDIGGQIEAGILQEERLQLFFDF